jgi:hypothetical protein
MSNGTITDMIGAPIGPLLASEWAELRHRGDDDLLQCCGVTSDFRDAVFDLFRDADNVFDHHGQVMPSLVTGFRAAYWAMVDHGLPDGRGGELIDRLVRYYLGDPPHPANDIDRMHHDQVYVELCNRSGRPTPRSRPTRFSVCALPETHQAYRYLVIHVELRRVDPDQGDRWTLRWGSYVYNVYTREWVVESIPEGVSVDDWRHSIEFRLSYAMNLATSLTAEVDVNGRTAADIVKADQERRGKS